MSLSVPLLMRHLPPPRLWPWLLLALAIAGLVLLPLGTILWLALGNSGGVWSHLAATTLPRYLGNTLILMGAVGALAGVSGTLTAWLVTMYRFPGARWLGWALLLPLAIPAYIGAYALTDLLDYSGPVQTALRGIFGWQSARDYWIPEIRSRWAAVLVLSAALSPYVYLLSRAALREQSAAIFDVARTLGAGPVARFLRIGLPLIRPAAAAGIAIVMMETGADFGVVDFFAVQTLTTGIFSTWLEGGSAAGAAQIALVSLALVLVLAGTERLSRRRARSHAHARGLTRPAPVRLHGGRAWLATLVCLLPVVAGFLLPGAIILHLALRHAGAWLDPRLLGAAANTLVTAGAGAVLTVALSLLLVYGLRLGGARAARGLLPVTALGYAAPGAVLGLGLLLPLAALDHRIADLGERLGLDAGMVLTGSAAAVVLAYLVRFFAIGQGAAEAAMDRIPPSLPMAARSLGRSPAGALRDVHLPMIRGSVGTALLLVFVDGVKELPATLLLRPFNFDTLATRVYDQASLEKIGDAAPPAMLVILTGLSAVILLARTSR
ncbi:ABC transporter permease [Mangrovicoccus algicola]|uniref:Iron ABC transporter permease n=1 Tax=Mangrovicoccus algicola TaxID=2771008 RepID=A0A8J6YV20_9RHOB|nr:iron ABC transporter permease [Mangrovicoccus algicola]MBE3636593.1 iron ABC transporter permease [Mangrovicoccus algicola]